MQLITLIFRWGKMSEIHPMLSVFIQLSPGEMLRGKSGLFSNIPIVSSLQVESAVLR